MRVALVHRLTHEIVLKIIENQIDNVVFLANFSYIFSLGLLLINTSHVTLVLVDVLWHHFNYFAHDLESLYTRSLFEEYDLDRSLYEIFPILRLHISQEVTEVLS